MFCPDLTYNTGTNKLQKIADAAPSGTKMYGWHNVTGAASTAQYAYDANGNMSSDPYKGMNVAYNFLNLPSQMSFSSGTKTIDVLYDATGRKLRKTVTDGGVLQYRQEYVNGIEYRYTTAGGTVLEAVYHAEGRVYNNGGTLRYEYAIRDHLGNTRLTFTDKNGNGVVDVTNTSANEILQENHFYPFGLDMAGPWMNDAAQDNQYKYNGKELNGDFGLNWMDYGARWYDGALGRWWCVDLMLGKYMEWSPYNYAKDNPVIFIDPNGMFTSWNPGMQEMIDGSKKVQERGIGNMQNGNTIYVLGLNGADKSVIKGLKSILEKFINAANLTTNVVMVGDSKKFDITKIKTTDAVAVVGGNKKEAADFILGNLDKGYLSEEFKTGLKDKFLKTPSFDNPELSDRGPQNWGYVIATSTMNEEIFKYPNGKTVTGSVTGTYSFLNMTDAVSLCILHGMGHNSGIQHPTNEDLGFMSVGPKLAMIIALHKGNIVSLIESTARNNPEMMQQMSNRFNSNNDNQ